MSKKRTIDDSELTEVTGGTLRDLQDFVDSDAPSPFKPPTGGGGGGGIRPEEDNPGGGFQHMEQSE